MMHPKEQVMGQVIKGDTSFDSPVNGGVLGFKWVH
jgi:hypothetical protein